MMFKKAIFAALLTGAIPSFAWAADCAAVKDSTERLKCYDAAAQDATSKPAAAETEKTVDPITVKMVDPTDLFVGTRKYQDREIGLRRIRCYYADAADYRCTAPDDGLSIFASSVAPKAAKDWIDENCDTVKKALLSSKCLMTIHFKYGSDDISSDVLSGYQKRVIIRPPAGIEVFSERSAKKVRR